MINKDLFVEKNSKNAYFFIALPFPFCNFYSCGIIILFYNILSYIVASAGPDPHVPPDPDPSTRICRFYDYMPRAADPDLYPRIWEFFTSCQSI